MNNDTWMILGTAIAILAFWGLIVLFIVALARRQRPVQRMAATLPTQITVCNECHRLYRGGSVEHEHSTQTYTTEPMAVLTVTDERHLTGSQTVVFLDDTEAALLLSARIVEESPATS